MQTLYRKYRPATLDDVLGQPHVTATLSRAIATATVAQAYLFAGSRGTGKTSVARILARAVNCLHRDDKDHPLPCNDCEHCRAIDLGAFLDVIELDAASNRGIDEIRALKEGVHVAPVLGGRKVYILDEAHMLTNEAFNALLKTLEEPPPGVTFILCTTEAAKVPVTIASRCQRLIFARATADTIAEQLTIMATGEGREVEPAAVAALALLADGGYRDAAMLLEQLLTTESQGVIDVQAVEQRFGVASHQAILQIVTAVCQGDPAAALPTIETLAANGTDMRHLAGQLITELRLILLATIAPDAAAWATADRIAVAAELGRTTSPGRLTASISALLDASTSRGAGPHPALALELALLGPRIPTPEPSAHATTLRPTASMSTSAVPAAPKTAPAATPAPQPPVTPPPASMPTAPTSTTPGPDTNPAIADLTGPEGDSADPVAQDYTAAAAPPPPVQPPVIESDASLLEVWTRILADLRPHSRTLEALLRDCTPLSYDGTILQVQFWYVFHQKKLEQDANKRLVEDVASAVMGTPVRIMTTLGDKNQRPRRPMGEQDVRNVATVEEEDLLQAASEIFGGEIM